MTKFARRFDDYLSRLRSDELKRMARLWGIKSTARKEEVLAALLRGLADPAQVRKAMAALEPFEYAALVLLKQAGGALSHKNLGAAILAAGISVPPKHLRSYGDVSSSITRALLHRGLILSSYGYDPTYLHEYGEGELVFTDERLLAAVGDELTYTPLVVPVGTSPTAVTYRQPPTMVLTIVALLQAIDALGGLHLTQKGEIRVNDLRKLQRTLQWPEEGLEQDGLRFANALDGVIEALRQSDWIVQQVDTLVLAAPVEQIANQPYPVLATTMLNGFLRLTNWQETGTSSYHGYYSRYYQQGRLILSIALKSIPLTESGFFTFADFSRALFERVGEYFSLNYPPHQPYSYNKSPAEVSKEREAWRAKLWTEWQTREAGWLQQALTGWLYFLGLVEIGWCDHQPVSFRLTPLGKQVFHPTAMADAAIPEPPTSETAAATWVVQPNFDVVVYLDRTTPSQLAFLERHAERTQAQQYTAHYRLTREAIYQGLESGSTIKNVLTTLQAGAHADLPRNVVTELREWAALRERITLHRRGHLLEFSDEAARQEALAHGLTGTLVGDRFLLLPPGNEPTTAKQQLSPRQRKLVTTINYAAPLPQCLTVTEMGRLTLQPGATDLLIEAQLDHWATRQEERGWQLTAAKLSVVGRGRQPELFRWLTARLQQPLPAVLAVALNHWVGVVTTTAEVAPVTILRCPDPEVMQALKNSALLAPYFRGALAADLLLVETKQVAALQQQLAWAGLTVKDEIILQKNRAAKKGKS